MDQNVPLHPVPSPAALCTPQLTDHPLGHLLRQVCEKHMLAARCLWRHGTRLLIWATDCGALFNPAGPLPFSEGLGKILVPCGVSVLRRGPWGPQLPWASAHWAQCFPRGTGPTLSFTTKLIPSAHAPSGAGAAADRCPGRRHCEDLNLPLSIAVR